MKDPIMSIVIYPEANPELFRVSITWWHAVSRNRGRPVRALTVYLRPSDVDQVREVLLGRGHHHLP